MLLLSCYYSWNFLGNTCRYFFSSYFSCNIINFLAALSCEDKEQPGMETLRALPSNFSFYDARKYFISSILELFSLLSPNKLIKLHPVLFYLCFRFFLSSIVFMNSDTIGILYLLLDTPLLLHLIIIKLLTMPT